MITQEDLQKAASLSWSEVEKQYPKVAMIIRYVANHYPKDFKRIFQHKMVAQMISSKYSNPQIESMIDKLAIFNGWEKISESSSD